MARGIPALLALLHASAALAQDHSRPAIAPPDADDLEQRQAAKCARYTSAWNFTLKKRGNAGLSADFLARHAAFIASGCTAKADVCPRSKEELDLANLMVILSMNAGMASTFAPFACVKTAQ